MPALRTSLRLVALAAALCACSALPWRDDAPGRLRVELEASRRLNPDDQGESLPTSVRLYQLAATGRAEAAELTQLLADPKEALGPDLLGAEELVLQPGDRVVRAVAREKGARALLVAAVVRRPAGTAWRQIVELPARGRDLEVALRVDEYRVERR